MRRITRDGRNRDTFTRVWWIFMLVAAGGVMYSALEFRRATTSTPVAPSNPVAQAKSSVARDSNLSASTREDVRPQDPAPLTTPATTQDEPFRFGLDYHEDLRVLRKSFDAQPVTMYAMPLCQISIKLILDEAGRYESVSYPAENPPRDQPADMHSFLYDGRRYTFHRDEFPAFNEMMELVGLGPSRWEPALPPDPYPFNKRWPDDVIEHLSALAERASATKR